MTTLADAGTVMDSGEDIAALDTIRRGLAYSPELGDGFGITMLLALVGTAGRVVVPIAVQQTLDKGINAPGVALPAPLSKRMRTRFSFS